jgi:hypothetical protein
VRGTLGVGRESAQRSSRRTRYTVCRLLGYVARRPPSVLEVLGQKDLEAFTAPTAVHGNDWGIA